MQHQVKLQLIAALTAVGAALAAGPAQAQETFVPGPYVGGNVGAARLKGDDRPDVPTDRSTIGGKVFGGYNFHPNFAVEGGYANTGEFDSSAGNLKGHGLFADAVGHYPLGNNFSVLGRLGVMRGKLEEGRTGTDLTDTNTTLKGGLGVEYSISRNHAVRGEWERYRFEADDDEKVHTDLFTVGYKFTF